MLVSKAPSFATDLHNTNSCSTAFCRELTEFYENLTQFSRWYCVAGGQASRRDLLIRFRVLLCEERGFDSGQIYSLSFWTIITCSLDGVYQHFRGTCCVCPLNVATVCCPEALAVEFLGAVLKIFSL